MDHNTRLTIAQRPQHNSAGTGISPISGSAPAPLDLALADLTARWERGDSPKAEDYAGWLDPTCPNDLIELAYTEFRLAEDDGLAPDPDAYTARFPALRRVLAIHGAFAAQRTQAGDDFSGAPPVVGDEIGPYRLIEELGRGGFARVFLAEQSDLDDRYVVVKLTTRRTPESRLLARARHPHIVEVLSHADVDGGLFQIICMPFLGGATLSAVLAERRRRGGRPSTGLDLLDDLDRASAQGYPVPPAGARLDREMLAALSYPRAVAWIMARLAEALDYAYGRGVLHSDVKPSNVLLTADGKPMLFDFNLSVDWRPVAADGAPIPGDAGGTLAYMAPERLRAVADPETNPLPAPAERHRADVYALGVVLLELLTGRPPQTPDEDTGGKPRARSLRELASAYVTSRGATGDGARIRPPRAQVAAGLRAILGRCLAVDPADRYRRAAELAEDLDRWRTDRPLLYAPDPVLSTGLPRWACRRRQLLAVVTTGLIVAGVTTFYSARVAHHLTTRGATASFEALMGLLDHDVFHSRRPGFGVIHGKGDVTRSARGILQCFRVLGEGDWRRFSEFADLAPAVRDDTEAFLLEQAYRFAHVLSGRSQADDWREGLFALERMEADRFPALHPELIRLRRLLNESNPPRPPHGSVPTWWNEYLQGVVAELRDDDAGLVAARTHYEAALALRPTSFWPSYRAAVVAFTCGDRCRVASEPVADDTLQLYSVAAAHLKTCVDQRSESAALRLRYATCLYYASRFVESFSQCDKARQLDQQNAEIFANLAFLRVALGQYDEAAKDIERYDELAGLDKYDAAAKPDPHMSFVHRSLGDEYLKKDQHEMALREFDRALELDSNNLAALYGRASQRAYLSTDASADFERLANHAQIEPGLRLNPHWLTAFHRTAQFHISQGRNEEAIRVATRAHDLSYRLHIFETESSYNLAVSYAAAAATDPSLLPTAVEQLKRAYGEIPDDQRTRFQRWYTHNRAFDTLRAHLGTTALYATH